MRERPHTLCRVSRVAGITRHFLTFGVRRLEIMCSGAHVGAAGMVRMIWLNCIFPHR